MFDIGFWELVIIAVMALVVVGPERLPIFLGKAGRLVGKARAYMASVRGDIDREIKKAERLADENEALLKLQETTKKAQQQAYETQQALNKPGSTAIDKLMGREATDSTTSEANTNDADNVARPLNHRPTANDSE